MTRHLLPALLLAASLGSVALLGPAAAASYEYDHNGSRMSVETTGEGSLTISYVAPRSGLSRIGVRPGTVLFDGSISDGYAEGLARIFSAQCGEVDYFVYGDLDPGRDFRLSGAAPVLGDGCRIVDNVTEGSNARLDFTALSRARPDPRPYPSPDPRPAPRPTPMPQVGAGCVTGVRTTLNVRAGPGTRFGRSGEIPAGTCGVEVLNRCEGDWCAVRYGSVVGWASMQYVRR